MQREECMNLNKPKYRADRKLARDFRMVTTVQKDLYPDGDYAELLSEITGRTFTEEQVRAFREDPTSGLNEDFMAYLSGLGFTFRVKNFEVDSGIEQQNPFACNMDKRYKGPKALSNDLRDVESMEAIGGPDAVRLGMIGVREVWIYPDEEARQQYLEVTLRLLERQIKERKNPLLPQRKK